LGFFFSLSPRALNEPTQASLSHQNKPEQSKAFFSQGYHEEALQPALWRVFFSFFLIIKKKKTQERKEERRGRGKRKKEPTTPVKCLFDTSTALVSFPI